MTDIRLLFKKYIILVWHEEGINFIGRAEAPDFTEEEIKELNTLEEEASNLARLENAKKEWE